ncbi:TIGR04206 family protein [Halosegnis marinus]|uniref:TIGR04206 family protein n=1 Tax=Halosegnis marinus TaxID=3034023 RepID=UPI0036132072
MTAVALLLACPWTVLVITGPNGTAVNGVFPLFVLDANLALSPPVRVIPVWRFFLAGGGIPRNPELWPTSVLTYLVALASAASGHVLGREDPRFTGGALALAGLTGLGVTWAFSHRLVYTSLPAGALAALALAWWYYGPAFRGTLGRDG